MKTLGTLLAVAMAFGVLISDAEAATKKKKKAKKSSSRGSGEVAMRELERRGFLDDATARRAFDDGDRAVTRYDMAVVVNRALEMMGSARGTGRILYREEASGEHLRDEMTGDVRTLGARVDGLTDRSQRLSEEIRAIRERRGR